MMKIFLSFLRFKTFEQKFLLIAVLSLTLCSQAFAAGNISSPKNESVSNPISGSNSAEIYVPPGSQIFTDVYPYPSSPARLEIRFRDETKTWGKRAFWGNGSSDAQKVRMGDSPPSERWTRLFINANDIGLEGRTITGVSYSVLNGEHVAWANTGVIIPTEDTSGGPSQNPPSIQPPAGNVPIITNAYTNKIQSGKNFSFNIEAKNNPERFRIVPKPGKSFPNWLEVTDRGVKGKAPRDTIESVYLEVTAYNNYGEHTASIRLAFLSPDRPAKFEISPKGPLQLEHPGGTAQFSVVKAINSFGNRINLQDAKDYCRRRAKYNWQTNWGGERASIDQNGFLRTVGIGKVSVNNQCAYGSTEIEIVPTTSPPELWIPTLVGWAGLPFEQAINTSNASQVFVSKTPNWLRVENNRTAVPTLRADIPEDIFGEFDFIVEAWNVGAAEIRETVTLQVINDAVPSEVIIKPSTTRKLRYPVNKIVQFQVTDIKNSRGITMSQADWEDKCQWHSSNPKVVSIDQEGIITAKELGLSSVYFSCGPYAGKMVESKKVPVEIGKANLLRVLAPKPNSSVNGNLKISGEFRGGLGDNIRPVTAQIFWNNIPGPVYDFSESCKGMYCAVGTSESWELAFNVHSLNLGTNFFRIEIRDTNGQVFRTANKSIRRHGVEFLGLKANDLIGGLVPLRAKALAYDKKVKLSRVEFYLDTVLPSKRIGSVSEGVENKYTYVWDTCTASNAPHNLIAVAIEEDNTTVHTDLMPVNVGNLGPAKCALAQALGQLE